MKNPAELKVVISTREVTCSEFNEYLGSKAWILSTGIKALCAFHLLI